MKSLSQHLNEKLIINKNFKSSDVLDEIKDSKWIEIQYAGKQTEDLEVFDKFIKYIRETNPKEISYATVSRTVNKDKYLCGINAENAYKIITLYHKSDVKHDLFERIIISLFPSLSESILFSHHLKLLRNLIAPLNTRSTFYKEGTPKHYEISKETFETLVNLYEEL